MYAMERWYITGLFTQTILYYYSSRADRLHIFRWNKLHAAHNITTSTTDCKNWKGNLVAVVIEMREKETRCLHTDEYTFIPLNILWTSLSSFPSSLEHQQQRNN
jgi:hypothetical protein